MSESPHAKKINAVLIIVGSIGILLIVFALGIYVGYTKATFVSDRGSNYYRDFLGGTPGLGMGASGMPGATHGIIGTVIEVASTSLVVRDNDNDEESIALPSDITIRMLDRTIDPGGIVVGDKIAVIGDPTSNGQIDAHFMRVFPASSSLPVPPGFAPTSNASNVIIIHTP